MTQDMTEEKIGDYEKQIPEEELWDDAFDEDEGESDSDDADDEAFDTDESGDEAIDTDEPGDGDLDTGASDEAPAPAKKKKRRKVAITLQDVHISYDIRNKGSIKGSIGKKHGKKRSFEAVKGVSLKIRRGMIVGIIGPNGAGKSTLLRAIAGIFSANSGRIDLHGNSVSLMAIGVGFEKTLTGRENIMLAGLLLGFPKKKVEAEMDRIIEFSELGEFIDRPVSSYSSGMYSKLAFSITAVLETDILLIDEVLSVGDRHFKKKSYKRMKRMIEKKRHTVLIVSHSDSTLRDLCDHVLWLDEGKMVMYGKTDDVLDAYNKAEDEKDREDIFLDAEEEEETDSSDESGIGTEV